jgi:hypothetical protein
MAVLEVAGGGGGAVVAVAEQWQEKEQGGCGFKSHGLIRAAGRDE